MPDALCILSLSSPLPSPPHKKGWEGEGMEGGLEGGHPAERVSDSVGGGGCVCGTWSSGGFARSKLAHNHHPQPSPPHRMPFAT